MDIDKLENCIAQCENCDWKGNKYKVLFKAWSDKYYCPDCGSDKIIWIGKVSLNELFNEMKKHYLKG